MNRGELEDAIEATLHRVQHGSLQVAAGVDEVLAAFDAHGAAGEPSGAATDQLEELEALIHEALGRAWRMAVAWPPGSEAARGIPAGYPDSPKAAAVILAATVTVARALAAGGRPVVTGPRPAPVHLVAAVGCAACRPRDHAAAGTLTTDPGKVTCGACRKVPAWREANAKARALEGAAVHYAPPGPDRPACLPHEYRTGSRAVTADPAAVTCGHCRKRDSWRQASAEARAARKPWVVALDGFLAEGGEVP